MVEPVRPACSGAGETPIELAVGEARTLSAAETACLWLGGDAEYVLAWADPRPVGSAMRGTESFGFSHLRITVEDGSDAATAAATVPSRPVHAWIDHVHRLAASDSFEDVFLLRPTPWRSGERIEWTETGSVRSADVLRVYGGYLVLVRPTSAGNIAEPWLAMLDESMAAIVELALPLLERVYGPRPFTSAAAGQLVLFAEPRPASIPGAVALRFNPMDSTAASTVSIGSAYGTKAEQLVALVTHELAHAWQWSYMGRSRSSTADPIAMGLQWSREGASDFVTTHVLRHHLGIGFVENWDWRCCREADAAGSTYARYARLVDGRFYRGYQSAASFMNDLLWRRIAAGEDSIAAMASIARGTLEGWYGYDVAGVKRRGLVPRMEEAVSGAWDPVDALLKWTISQALDDRSAALDYHNPSFARINGEPYGWQPDGRATSRSGQSTSTAREPGSVGYFELSAGRGGAVFSAASEPDPVRWLLVRRL